MSPQEQPLLYATIESAVSRGPLSSSHFAVAGWHHTCAQISQSQTNKTLRCRGPRIAVSSEILIMWFPGQLLEHLLVSNVTAELTHPCLDSSTVDSDLSSLGCGRCC